MIQKLRLRKLKSKRKYEILRLSKVSFPTVHSRHYTKDYNLERVQILDKDVQKCLSKWITSSLHATLGET